jgi:hypothetical protein
VLNKVLKKELNENSPLDVVINHYPSPWLSWDLYNLYTGRQRQTRQVKRWTGKRADRQEGRQADRQMCRQANVQKGRQAGRQAGRWEVSMVLDNFDSDNQTQAN